MGLLSDRTYGIGGPRHRMVGWLSEDTPFGKFEVLKSILRNGDSILDVGCGTGLLVDWLDNEGYDVDYHGLDLSNKFLSVFAEAHPELLDRLSEGSALSPFNEKYDVTVSFGLTSDLNGVDQAAALIGNMVESARDAAIVEFWDETLFDPIGDGIPPKSWSIDRITSAAKRVCPGCDVNVMRPLNWSDFAVVVFKR